MPISDLPPLSDELILGLLAKDSSSRADNAAILEYFNEHPDLAERSAFCKHCYKQIYTYLFVDDHTVGFIRHDMYLELWEGNYLTKTAQVNLTWDAVAAKIADLIEQGRLMVPIKATPVQQQMCNSVLWRCTIWMYRGGHLILSSVRAEYYDRAMKIRRSMFSVM